MRAFIMLFTAAALAAQIPQQDSRNTNTPDTDTKAKLPEFHDLHSWEARKAHLRKQIMNAAGLYPMPAHGIPHAEIFGKLDRDGYTIEKVLVETLSGYYLGGNLYRPKNGVTKHPAMLNPHGHWTYGRLENTDNFSGPLLATNLARMGFVVFAYDMVGYNDTLQTPHKFGSPKEQLWSFGPLQLQLWNSIRATDFISSLPDVDASKIGITGASGGATQIFMLAAVDDRIAFSAPVNMVSAIMQGGDFCENAPGLRIGTNNVEIAAMFAPKPMFIVSATGDWTKNVPREEFPAIQRIYDLYGKHDNVDVIQIEAPHNYNQKSREAVYRFMAKQIGTEWTAEKHTPIEMLQDMLALHGRSLPTGAIDYDGVFKEWQALNTDSSRAKERLQLTLGVEWPEKVFYSGSINGNTANILLRSSLSAGDYVSGRESLSSEPVVLVIHPDGAQAAWKDPYVEKLLSANRHVMVIDAFQTGKAVAPRNRSHNHFLTFNLSDDACRVQDILTTLAYLHQAKKVPIELMGIGDAAVWAYFAAAVAPITVTVHADLSKFHGTDEDYLRAFNVPGIQRAGGLAAAKQALDSSQSHGWQ